MLHNLGDYKSIKENEYDESETKCCQFISLHRQHSHKTIPVPLVIIDLLRVRDAILPEFKDHLGALSHRCIIPITPRQKVRVFLLEIWIADNQCFCNYIF